MNIVGFRPKSRITQRSFIRQLFALIPVLHDFFHFPYIKPKNY